jgi:hypothetical protein
MSRDDCDHERAAVTYNSLQVPRAPALKTYLGSAAVTFKISHATA